MHYVDIAFPSGKVLKVPDHMAGEYQRIVLRSKTLFNEFEPTRPYSTGYRYEQVGEHEWLIFKMDDKPHFWVSAELMADGTIETRCEAVQDMGEGNVLPLGPCPSRARYGVCKHVEGIVVACLEKGGR